MFRMHSQVHNILWKEELWEVRLAHPLKYKKLIMGTAARKQDEALKAALGVKGTPKEGAEAAMAAAQGRPLPTKTVDIPAMTGTVQ